MKKDLIEMVFIIDRSGSMSGLEADTIGGFNSLVNKQKKEQGDAIITTVLFDDKYELLHDRFNLKAVKTITENEYFVRGSTALLDAIGISLNKTLNAYKNTAFDEKPEKVMFIITTDGFENSSQEYSYEKINKMITYAKNEYGFEFIFLGANIDAVKEAKKFGISKDMAVDYHADSEGTALAYCEMSEAIAMLRSEKKMSKNWRKKLDLDYKKRK